MIGKDVSNGGQPFPMAERHFLWYTDIFVCHSVIKLRLSSLFENLIYLKIFFKVTTSVYENNHWCYVPLVVDSFINFISWDAINLLVFIFD